MGAVVVVMSLDHTPPHLVNGAEDVSVEEAATEDPVEPLHSITEAKAGKRPDKTDRACRLTMSVGLGGASPLTQRFIMKMVSFSLIQGNKYFGKVDGTRFFIGLRVTFQGNKGLMNVQGTALRAASRKAGGAPEATHQHQPRLEPAPLPRLENLVWLG